MKLITRKGSGWEAPSAIAVVARVGGYWSRGKFYKAKQAYGYIWKYVQLKEEGVI